MFSFDSTIKTEKYKPFPEEKGNPFQKRMEEKRRALDYRTVHVAGIENQIGDTLRAVIPMTDAGDAMLVEIMLTAYRRNYDLLVLYTTVLRYEPDLEGDLLLRVEDWNLPARWGISDCLPRSGNFITSIPFSCRRTPIRTR